MILDPKLTATQLWNIANDSENWHTDVFDALITHPNSYRELADWAKEALGQVSYDTLSSPPEPEIEQEKRRKISFFSKKKILAKPVAGVSQSSSDVEASFDISATSKKSIFFKPVPLILPILLGILLVLASTALAIQIAKPAPTEKITVVKTVKSIASCKPTPTKPKR